MTSSAPNSVCTSRAPEVPAATGDSENEPPRRRWGGRWVYLGIAGTAIYVGFGVLSFLPRSPIVPPYPSELERLSPYPPLARLFHGSPSLLVVAFGVFLVSAFAVFALALRRARQRPQEVRAPGLWAGWFAILLVPTPPIASQDVFSYAAYGRMAAVHFENPYLSGPSRIADDPTANYVGRMWWDMPSVYGPVMQGIAWGTARLFGSLGGLVLALKGVAAAVFALALWLLQRSAGELSRSASLAVVAIGWNPLVLIHIVGGGHNDILVATALLAGLLLHLGGRRLLASVAITLGALVKLTALVPLGLYLLFVWRKRDEAGGWWKPAAVAAVSAGTFIAAYAPYWKGFATLDGLVRVSGLETAISIPVVSAKVLYLGLQSLGLQPLALSAWTAFFRVGLAALLGIYVLMLWRRLGRSEEMLPEVWGKALLAFCLTTAYLLPWYLVWPMLLLALVPQGRAFRVSMVAAFVYSFTQLPGGYVLLSPNIKALGEGVGKAVFFAAVVVFGLWVWFSRAGALFDPRTKIGVAASARR